MQALSRQLGQPQLLNTRKSILCDLQGDHADLAQRNTLLLPAARGRSKALLVHSGWCMLYRELRDGRRQIVQFCLPGDLVIAGEWDTASRPFSVAAITPVSYSTIALDDLAVRLQQNPRLAIDLLLNEAHEVYLSRCHLLSLGRFNARERIAALLLGLLQRLSAIGQTLTADAWCQMDWPLNQELLADATGLSSVHVSRTFRRLEKAGLVRREERGLLAVHVAGLRRLVPDMPSPAAAVDATAQH